MNEQLLQIPDKFTLAELIKEIERVKPKEIIMSPAQAVHYYSLMFEPPKNIFRMTFRGLPIKIEL